MLERRILPYYRSQVNKITSKSNRKCKKDNHSQPTKSIVRSLLCVQIGFLTLILYQTNEKSRYSIWKIKRTFSLDLKLRSPTAEYRPRTKWRRGKYQGHFSSA